MLFLAENSTLYGAIGVAAILFVTTTIQKLL